MNAPGDSQSPDFVHIRYGANQSETHHIVPADKEDVPDKDKLEFLYEGTSGERKLRSFSNETPRQLLRWIATALSKKVQKAVEIQCYWDVQNQNLWISTNKWSKNKKLAEAVNKLRAERAHFQKGNYAAGRVRRHVVKLLGRQAGRQQQQGTDRQQVAIYNAFMTGTVHVPLARYPAFPAKQIDLHAERRISIAVGHALDSNYLGGIMRPCLICSRALNLRGARSGPLWNSVPSLHGYDFDEAIDHAIANGVITHVSRDRYTDSLDINHDTDSDSGEDE